MQIICYTDILYYKFGNTFSYKCMFLFVSSNIKSYNPAWAQPVRFCNGSFHPSLWVLSAILHLHIYAISYWQTVSTQRSNNFLNILKPKLSKK